MAVFCISIATVVRSGQTIFSEMTIKSVKKIMAAVAMLVICGQTLCATETYPKREVRAVWVTPINNGWPTSGSYGNITSMQNECQTILNRAKECGFNAIYFHCRPMADRLYNKTSYTHAGTTYTVYEPQSKYVSGTRGTTTTFDALEYWVSEAHKRGMELHAWVNPLRWVTMSGAHVKGDITTEYKNVYNDVAVKDWMITAQQKNADGTIKETRFTFNPGDSRAMARLKNVCAVITGNYDIDGLVFDDYFYPDYIAQNSSADDWSDYEKYTAGGGTLSIGDWRRENVNAMVRMVDEITHSIKPYVKFGIGPAGASWMGARKEDGLEGLTYTSNGKANYFSYTYDGRTTTASDWQYDGLFSDVIAWMREGTIDYVSPQIYWNTTGDTSVPGSAAPRNPFGPLAKWWELAGEKFGVHCYPSMSLTFVESADNDASYAELMKQLKYTRETSKTDNLGAVAYSSRTLLGPDSRYKANIRWKYKQQFYNKPAATPTINGDKGSNPGKISGFKLSGTTLSWNAISGMRYIAYAIPTTVDPVEASSVDHNGFKAEYMLDNMLYSNSVSVEGKTSGYWYAVAPLDRYGNEWDYTTYGNVPASQMAEVTLLSPADGVTSEWVQNFSYTGTSGATFAFELAEDALFSKIVASQTSTATSATVDMVNFTSGKTYYWRVTASKTGYKNAVSLARKLVIPQKSNLGAVTLVSPADGVIAVRQQVFEWNDGAGADSYVLEISRNADFSSMEAKVPTTAKKVTFDMTYLDINTKYYWRVRSVKTYHNDALSESRSFNTPDVSQLDAPRLDYPIWGEKVTGDFCFTFGQVGATSYILEVSTDLDFNNIFFTASSGWNTVSTCLQYSVPLNLFPQGTYYWRVKVSKNNYKDNVSVKQHFIVGSGETLSNYVPYRDPSSYNMHENKLMLTNLWVRDASHNPFGYDESDVRDMTARGDLNGDQNGADIVYLAYKAGSALLRLDGSTGRELNPLSLSFDSKFNSSLWAPNGVLVDADNNLLVHNLRISGNLTIAKVDVRTGACTTVFAQAASSRVDHLSVYGSVDGNFTVFAAGPDGSPRTTKVHRWVVSSGNVSGPETMNLGDKGPAPRILAVDGSTFYLDGYNDVVSRYSFVNNASTAQSATASASSFHTLAKTGNGMAIFQHDGQWYMVMADGTCDGKSVDRWKIARGDYYPGGFSGSLEMWNFPETGLGSADRPSLDYAMPVAVVQRDSQNALTRAAGAQTSTIYAYSSGNGLAAYTLGKQVVTAVDAIETDMAPQPKLYGNNLDFGCEVDSYQVYDMSGRIVAQGSGVHNAELSLLSGVYIVIVEKAGIRNSTRISLR